MVISSLFKRSLALAALVSVSILGLGDRVRAISEENDKVLFGPVTLVPGQGIRVNVVALGGSDGIQDPGILPWTFRVRMFNRRGAVVVERSLQLMPGAVGSVAIRIGDPDQMPVEQRPSRAEIVGFNPQPDPPGIYRASLEVFSLRTGRTTLLLGGPDTVPVARPAGTAQ